nr:protein FAM151B isoform X2 [Halyomorpha halys]
MKSFVYLVSGNLKRCQFSSLNKVSPLLFLRAGQNRQNIVNKAVMGRHETLADYFPEIKGDLTKVTWEHAVNSMEMLAEALNGKALMIEADIVLGWKSEEDRENQTTRIPVMAHPPAVISNLTLEQFLYTFMESGVRKGIKLDFKSRGAFAGSEWLLEKLYYEKYRDFPVWLNADIVPGPVNATTQVVDPDYFLSSCFTKFPYATISVGWTTRLEPGSLEGSYSKEDVDLMTEVLSNNLITMPVTFAVRAAFAARSVERMVALVETSPPGSTLTIWSSVASDVIDVAALGTLIDQVGTDKVYLDLPGEIISHLNHSKKTNKSTTFVPSLPMTFLALFFTIFAYYFL